MGNNLTEVQKQIVCSLYFAHKKGLIELSSEDLATELTLDSNFVRDQIHLLVTLGLLDRVEVADSACLSSMGVKIGNQLLERENFGKSRPSNPPFQTDLLHDEPSRRDKSDDSSWTLSPPSTITISPEGLFAIWLKLAFQNWADVIDEANLNRDENSKLKVLGQGFVGHPASLELLTRALMKSLKP